MERSPGGLASVFGLLPMPYGSTGHRMSPVHVFAAEDAKDVLETPELYIILSFSYPFLMYVYLVHNASEPSSCTSRYLALRATDHHGSLGSW